MQHPELALIPIFMVSDYVLTLVGARLYGGTPDARAAHELNLRNRDVVPQQRPMPVGLLIAGKTAGICSDCVAGSAAVLAEQRPAASVPAAA